MKYGVVLLMIGLSMMSFAYANPYSFNLYEEDVSKLNELDDVNITSALEAQVLIYDESSELWENGWLNDSGHHVNASDYWITDEGTLGTFNSTQMENNGGTLSIIISWLTGVIDNRIDTLACQLSGGSDCEMQGDIRMNGNDINMGKGNITNLNSIGFNITGCDGEIHEAGYICYDYDADTLSLTTQTGQVIRLSRVISERGINRNGDLTKGDVVYMSGSSGDNPEFKQADGSNVSESDLIGVLTVDCLSNEICPVTVWGFVNDLDTSMWNEKDKLYINSSNPGKFTNVIPTLPNNPVWVATVIRSHATQGRIFVSPRIDPSDGFLINNIYATDSIKVMNNISTGGQINVSGNIIAGDRLFVGGDPSQTQSAINPGDVAIFGNVIIGQGTLAVIPDPYALSVAFFNNGADDPGESIFYLNFSGSLNTSQELFCDFLNNPFSNDSKRDAIQVIFSAEFGLDNIYLAINRVVNSSCVTIATQIFGNDNVPGLSSVSYVLTPQPVFGVTDNDLVLNGIRMFYETNESLFTFGTYTWQNTLQDKPGGPLFNQAFTTADGDTEYVLGTQTGLNNSGGFFRNSQGIFSTKDYTESEKQNLSLLHDMFYRWDKINVSHALTYDSQTGGADLAVEHGIETRQLVLHNDLGDGALIVSAGIAEFNLVGNDFEINNGSAYIGSPVEFEQGFNAGDPVPIFIERFLSTLGIFSNIQTDSGDWTSILDTVHCDEGQCAQGTGAGSGIVSMQTNFSTLDINETTLSFVYSNLNLIGLGELNAVVNNNEGSGDIEVFVDATTDITKEYEQVSLPASMDNKSLVTLTFTCDVASILKPTRQCFVDTVKTNGTAISTTVQNVSSFDSQICFRDGIRDSNGICEDGIRYSAENDTIVMSSLTMQSPDGTYWNCGPDNSGVWACS